MFPKLSPSNLTQCPCKQCQAKFCQGRHQMTFKNEYNYASENSKQIAMLECVFCSVEVTIEIPDHIPKNQVEKYARKIGDRINNGDIILPRQDTLRHR